MNELDRNQYLLSMDGDAFAGLKTDINEILKKTLASMELKDSDEADISIKLAIELHKRIDDETGRVVVFPIVSHKVSSVMKTKTETEGILNSKCDFELVYDGDIGEYIIRRLPKAQLELFENGLHANTAFEREAREAKGA